LKGEAHRHARRRSGVAESSARARAATKRGGAVTVPKGADAAIAASDREAIVDTDAPRTATTAGSGDVPTGGVRGLSPQGAEPFLARAEDGRRHAHDDLSAQERERGPGRSPRRPLRRRRRSRTLKATHHPLI